MREKYLNLLFKVYPNLTEYDKKVFNEIMNDDGLGKCKPYFHLYGFLFGWFYLLYRKAYIEAFSVLIFSLMVGYFYLPGIIIVNSLLGGFCYYFLYLNKFNNDVDKCNGIGITDIECLESKTRTSYVPVIVAIVVILFLIWPILYAVITGHHLRN